MLGVVLLVLSVIIMKIYLPLLPAILKNLFQNYKNAPCSSACGSAKKIIVFWNNLSWHPCLIQF